MQKAFRLLLALVTVFMFVSVTQQGTANATGPACHYTVNLAGDYAGAAATGFTCVDVSSKSVMDALPAGMKGLFWLGNLDNSGCTSSLTDAQVVSKVQANIGDPKFSGIYFIADEPHTSSCSTAVADVTARSNLVKQTDPNAKTFIVVLDGSSHPGEYQAFANAADYIGVDPYPCNQTRSTCDFTGMTNKINKALTYIPANRMVPVFQTFGQTCNSSSSHYYRLPTVSELQTMLGIWDSKTAPSVRPFDYAYSWGNQSSSCPTLKDATGTTYPNLRQVMANYFASM